MDSLTASGHECSIEAVTLGDASDEAAEQVDCDLFVALHATKIGPVAQQRAAAANKPWICVFTGTDLNGQPSPRAIEAVRSAAARVVLAPHAQKRAKVLFGEIETELIPQAARALPERRGFNVANSEFCPEAPKLDREDFLILQPCGIRSIKAPRVGVEALAPLAARHSELKLWIAGPELDAKEGDALRETLAQHEWANWIGELEPYQLAAATRRADLVISTSRSEGAAPNALLEAALFSRPVLASAIPAHRFFPGPDFLFRSDEELRDRVAELLDDRKTSALTSRQLAELTRTRFDRKTEAVAWNRLVLRVGGIG